MIEFHKVTWYSKLLSAIVLFVISPFLIFYLYTQYTDTQEILRKQNFATFIPPPRLSKALTATTSTTTLVQTVSVATSTLPSVTVPPPDSIPVYVFQKPDIPSDGLNYMPTFKDSSGVSYNFQTVAEGNNPSRGYWLIKTDGTGRHVFGTVLFTGKIESITVSIDNTYAAFETRNRISDSDVDFQLYVVNLRNGQSVHPSFPETSSIQNTIPYFESLNWNSDNSLSLVFYHIFPSGNNNYYRTEQRGLWTYNANTNKYDFISTTQVEQGTGLSLFSNQGNLAGQKLSEGSHVVDGVSFGIVPVYEIAPSKVLGVNANASYNYDQVQETVWKGHTVIEGRPVGSNDGVYDSSGNLVYQQGAYWFGMFMDHVLTFHYTNHDYFILGGGDCGNKSCGYEYYVFRIDQDGSVHSVWTDTKHPLWRGSEDNDGTTDNRNKIDFVAGYQNNVFLFVKNDDGTQHVIELDQNGVLLKQFNTTGLEINSIFTS